MVNSLWVTHLERHWSLVHFFSTQFSVCSALYPVMRSRFYSCLFHQIWHFFLLLSVSPLIKKLDGRDISLSLSDLCWVYVLFHLTAWERIPQISCSLLNPLSLFLTLSSSHRNSIVSPLPSDLISPHPYKVSLSSFFTIQAKLMPWKIQVPHTFQSSGRCLTAKHRGKTGKICSPFPGKYMMKMSSMGQDMRASFPVILLIVGHHLQNVNNYYYLVAGVIRVYHILRKSGKNKTY